MILYKPPTLYERGTIQRILSACYQDFFTYFPGEKEKMNDQWKQEEEAVYKSPGISGHAMFTCINKEVIGYFTWDDRSYPKGIIGQNCIVPTYQNQGFGKKQIEMIEEKFKRSSFKEISVVTGDHIFFIPAQKMYLSCGFIQKRIFEGSLFKNIEFYKLI